MIYAALGILVTLLLAAGALVALVDRAYRAQLAAERERRKAAEARAAQAEASAVAAQPDRLLDALATPDDGLLDAVFGPPDSPGWSTSVASPRGSGEMVIRLDDSNDAD